MERSEKLYGQLFKKYKVAIFNYAKKLLQDDLDAAADITQEVFIKLWNSLEGLESEYNAKAWLYVCTRNACFNVLATLKRHHKVDPETHLTEEIFNVDPNYDFDIIEVDVMVFIYQKIKEMPPMRQRVIKMFFKGISSTKIAKKLRITQKTALNTKLTAIKQLQEAIKLKYGSSLNI